MEDFNFSNIEGLALNTTSHKIILETFVLLTCSNYKRGLLEDHMLEISHTFEQSTFHVYTLLLQL